MEFVLSRVLQCWVVWLSYVVGIEVRSSVFAVVAKFPFVVDVETMETWGKVSHQTADDHGLRMTPLEQPHLSIY